MKLLIGPTAKKLRVEKGLKQRAVAQEIGTSNGNLCRFENGQQGLSLKLLEKLSTVLGTSPEELLNFNSQPSEIQELSILLSKMNDNQLAMVKQFISAVNADQNES
tara:strand:+ start:364 stop:681 length:318 start_codon:yes stop_codon:yes gene_type:complete